LHLDFADHIEQRQQAFRDGQLALNQIAKDLGATDFITKGTGAAELLARLDSLVALGRSQEALEEARAGAAIDVVTGLPQRLFLLRQAEQSLSFFHRHGGHVGILVVGLDRFDEIVAAEGEKLGDALMNRFGQVLAGVALLLLGPAAAAGDR